MKTLHDVALFLSDNPRARAYLSAMFSLHLKPSCVILTQQNRIAQNLKIEDTSLFNNRMSISSECQRRAIKLYETGSSSINKETISLISKIPAEFIIFAGNPGCILPKGCFELDKQFIHIHPGELPNYRGSTTFYYSILKENKVGLSAFFMNQDIDAGQVIDEMSLDIKKQPFIDKASLDTILDPYLRSLLLKKILVRYSTDPKSLCSKKNSANDRENKNYFIIHPLLKHLSILKVSSCA